MTRRGRTAAGLLAIVGGVLATAALTAWLNGGWNLAFSQLSPDGRYRVDLYEGSRWQRAAYLPWYEEPGFARLSRTRDGRLLGTSRVIELANSPVAWLQDGVLIATQAQYHLDIGRWD